MATYLYCVGRGSPVGASERRPALPRGIAGTIVRVLPAGAVEAWVSTVDERMPRPSLIAVREHDDVVAAALATGRTPLPARFGQTWASDAACVSSLKQRGAELARQLDRVAGMVEMTVCTRSPKLSSPSRRSEPNLAQGGPGTVYLHHLRARADHDRHLRGVLDTLRSRLQGAIAPFSHGELGEVRGDDEGPTVSISYLVRRVDEARFRRAVENVAREVATRLVVVGPRAPYSFAPAARHTGRADDGGLVQAP